MIRGIELTAVLAALTLTGLVLLDDAAAGPERERRQNDRVIDACIAEIEQHVDYSQAARVRHWVTSVRQKNLIETEMEIETSITAGGEDTASRRYKVRCVTGVLIDVVEFRIDEMDS